MSLHLSQMTGPAVGGLEPSAIVIVPVGSTEQHGPHLPTGTDTTIASALAERAAEALNADEHRCDRPECLVAPVLSYGASGEHDGFAGTLSIGESAVETVLVELVRSADRHSGVVVVNTHGGNERALRRAAALLREEGRRCLVWSPGTVLAGQAAAQVAVQAAGGRPFDAHAGWFETSLMLALDPERLQFELAEPGDERPLADVIGVLVTEGVAAVSPNGVLGNPLGATREIGEALMKVLVADLVSSVADWALEVDAGVLAPEAGAPAPEAGAR
ncbi:MAG: mycofactocin biosynthesis peptidyl-dipeptidase MftE [Acidimicrobiales bacterium]